MNQKLGFELVSDMLEFLLGVTSVQGCAQLMSRESNLTRL